jgi:hypothetical protein
MGNDDNDDYVDNDDENELLLSLLAWFASLRVCLVALDEIM